MRYIAERRDRARCGARTRACRVGTLADAVCRGAKKCRDESRHSRQDCLRHGATQIEKGRSRMSRTNRQGWYLTITKVIS